MDLLEVHDVNTRNFSEVTKIYSENFPDITRQSLDLIKLRLKNGQNQLFITNNQKEVIAFALIYHLLNPNILLLEYYAVKSEYRNRGIGTAFLKELFKRLKLEEMERYLIFEVDDPNYGIDQKERKKRIQFYKALNVVQIQKMRYLFPSLSGTEYLEMLIMIYPCPKRHIITSNMLKTIITELYVENYHRSINDPLLKRTLSLIPKKIRFI
jgi:ribosomal protein S18 acetylase RimI-like enzyme